ncbi:hypothetical protein Slin15195_G112890 [Septoria linicola]|uniref:Uncharacterized protein n=1 Tax=Septoria linicola TaxID=215465 RepID=A0A9Q9B4A6_9PEZI|nr:hypothetical protein Slin15195_G112890 [Septoria linicola]
MNQPANATAAASKTNCGSSEMSTLQTMSKYEKPKGMPSEGSCEDTSITAQPEEPTADSKHPEPNFTHFKTTKTRRPSEHDIFLAPDTLKSALSDAEYNVMIDTLVEAAVNEHNNWGAEVADAIVKRFMGGERDVSFAEALRDDCWSVDGLVGLGMLIVLVWLAIVV